MQQKLGRGIADLISPAGELLKDELLAIDELYKVCVLGNTLKVNVYLFAYNVNCSAYYAVCHFGCSCYYYLYTS